LMAVPPGPCAFLALATAAPSQALKYEDCRHYPT
jgi:hypothetical protein